MLLVYLVHLPNTATPPPPNWPLSRPRIRLLALETNKKNEKCIVITVKTRIDTYEAFALLDIGDALGKKQPPSHVL